MAESLDEKREEKDAAVAAEENGHGDAAAIAPPEAPADPDPREVDNANPPEDQVGDGEQVNMDDEIIDVGGTLSDAPGGKRANKSTIAISGQSYELGGQFKKGQIVRAEIELKLGEVHFIDKEDGNGNVITTTRKHVARVVGFHPIKPE